MANKGVILTESPDFTATALIASSCEEPMELLHFSHPPSLLLPPQIPTSQLSDAAGFSPRAQFLLSGIDDPVPAVIGPPGRISDTQL